MFDTTTDSCSSQQQLFTTRYSYRSSDQEFVFCCRGRPFAALVSPNLPTPTSSLIDYDLAKSLGLKVTDLQCKKFFFAGNKMRILGLVSTTVQCIQNGRTGSNFHIKGFVIADLYKILDTHCVAGNKMQQQIQSLLETSDTSEADDDDEDIDKVLNNERKCETAPKSVKKNEVSSHTQQAPGPQTGRRHPTSSSPRSGNPSSTTRVASTCSSVPTVQYGCTFPPTTPASAIPFDPHEECTPIPPGICPNDSSIYGLVARDDARTDEELYWRQYCEEKPWLSSWEDNKPRVVNLLHDHCCDMLRLGDWDQLEDPRGHQARHILLANIRRTAPDRVCSLCSYNLITNHKCSLSSKNTIAKHCDDCCKQLNLTGGGRK